MDKDNQGKMDPKPICLENLDNKGILDFHFEILFWEASVREVTSMLQDWNWPHDGILLTT